MRVAGSLWSVPPGEQLDTVAHLASRGLSRLHWDASDGLFAAAGGFSAEHARELTLLGGLDAEAHLMVSDPFAEVDAWTDFCDVIYLHAEVDEWPRAADRISRRGSRPGLAVRLESSVESLPRDMPMLCMSITPGQAGSVFDRRVLPRVRRLRELSPDRSLSVDGGVTRFLVADLAEAGVESIVVGTDLVAADGAQRWGDVLRPIH